MNKTMAARIAAGLLAGGVEMDALPKDEREKPQAMADFITSSVGYLSTLFPNERINLLMLEVWAIVGTEHVRPMLGPPVPTLSFAVLGEQAVIIMPHNFLDLIEEDLTMQTAAMVFIGSQVVDYWNGRTLGMADPKERARILVEIRERAMAYEAEFLLTCLTMGPAFEETLNEYQREVLAKYPEGLESPAAKTLLYERKPVPDHSPYTVQA